MNLLHCRARVLLYCSRCDGKLVRLGRCSSPNSPWSSDSAAGGCACFVVSLANRTLLWWDRIAYHLQQPYMFGRPLRVKNGPIASIVCRSTLLFFRFTCLYFSLFLASRFFTIACRTSNGSTRICGIRRVKSGCRYTPDRFVNLQSAER